MPEIHVPSARPSSVSLTRASLLKFAGLLASVFILAIALLLYLAHNLNQTERMESDFYAKKAVQSLEKSLKSTVKD